MRRPRLHPSRRKLQHWLEHGDESLDAHVETCERCSRILEAAERPHDPFQTVLNTLLRPPDDLHQRLRVGIAEKLQTREDLRLLSEMLGVPLDTMRAMGTSREDR